MLCHEQVIFLTQRPISEEYKRSAQFKGMIINTQRFIILGTHLPYCTRLLLFNGKYLQFYVQKTSTPVWKLSVSYPKEHYDVFFLPPNCYYVRQCIYCQVGLGVID